MVLKTNITDPLTGFKAAVVSENGEKNSIAVATRPLKKFINKYLLFVNPSYGADMNINVTFGGSPIGIHNGTDTALWTGSAISGTWVFDSTTQAQSGTKSVDGTATVNNNIAQFAKGSNQSLTGHTAITGYVYLSAWDNKGTKHIEFYGWDTNTSTIVGNSINLDDYIDFYTIGSWQKFSIPLDDMSLENKTLDSFRVKTIDLGPGSPPDYYLDNIQVEETGAPVTFKIQPEKGTWLHIYSLGVGMADAYTGYIDTAAANTFPTLLNIPYNSFLGVSKLPIGMVVKGHVDGEDLFAATFRQLQDFLAFSAGEFKSSGSDGTNTWFNITLNMIEPYILKDEKDDYIEITINDNMEGLLHLRVSASCKEEKRPIS